MSKKKIDSEEQEWIDGFWCPRKLENGMVLAARGAVYILHGIEKKCPLDELDDEEKEMRRQMLYMGILASSQRTLEEMAKKIASGETTEAKLIPILEEMGKEIGEEFKVSYGGD